MLPSRTQLGDSLNLKPGRVIGGKYVTQELLGRGWEGEVYRVEEIRTGIPRAAKLFFPHRNDKDKVVKAYANKLNRLRNCNLVVQYHHCETVTIRKQPITCLISEFVEGRVLADFVNARRGKRLPPYEALHLLYTLARGLEEIHARGEYHGDFHEENIFVQPRGIFFDVKLIDFHHWSKGRAEERDTDLINLISVFYNALGGRAHYAKLPPEIRQICKGLRHDLIKKAFPTVRRLREHLETFDRG